MGRKPGVINEERCKERKNWVKEREDNGLKNAEEQSTKMEPKKKITNKRQGNILKNKRKRNGKCGNINSGKQDKKKI